MRGRVAKVYCRNCGIELPSWAAFCDRCGTPVDHSVSPDDPIGQVEFTNGLAEPLWDEADEARSEGDGGIDDALLDDEAFPADGNTQLMEADTSSNGETQLMDEALDVSGETQLMEEMPEEGKEGENLDNEGLEANDEPPAMDEDSAATDEDAGDQNEEGTESTETDESTSAEEVDATDSHEPSDEDDAISEDDSHEVSEGSEAPFRQPFDTIDVGMDSNWYEGSSRRSYSRPADHRRAFETERTRESNVLNIWVVIGIAAVAIATGLFGAHLIFDNASDAISEDGQPVITSQSVPKAEATEVIASLDGWWKTNRTFDGRYWHLQSGLMELYAADGKLASEVLIDPNSVEYLSSGPGGIEGAGYYLRDVGFYLLDDDQDTLYAINQDGTADEDANLLRSDSPAFVSDGEKEESPAEPTDDADPSEYILPDAATRVYDNSELEALSNHDLFVARNEIYARHGYVFETGELSEYFSSKSWYQPSDVFNEGEISEIERQNVSAILAIEQARGSQYM